MGMVLTLSTGSMPLHMSIAVCPVCPELLRTPERQIVTSPTFYLATLSSSRKQLNMTVWYSLTVAITETGLEPYVADQKDRISDMPLNSVATVKTPLYQILHFPLRTVHLLCYIPGVVTLYSYVAEASPCLVACMVARTVSLDTQGVCTYTLYSISTHRMTEGPYWIG